MTADSMPPPRQPRTQVRLRQSGRRRSNPANLPALSTNAWIDGALLALLAVALAVKVVVLFQLGDHPLLQPQGELDGTYYVELARKVASGGPLAVGEAFFVSPLYVYFLAAVFRFGGDLAAARLVQILLGAIAVGLLYLTARQWYGPRAARAGAALAILTGVFSFYEVLILQAALDPFLAACALWAVSRAQQDGAWWRFMLAGIATGLLVLNRPNALPYGLLVIAGIGTAAWWRHRGGASVSAQAPRTAPGSLRPAWRRAALYAAGLALVLAGNGLRNYSASGEFVLVASHGGLNFYIGNHAGADGTYQPLPGITPSIVGQQRDATREAEAEAGRTLTASEVSDVFYRRARAWIAGDPAAALRLFVRKATLVLHRANVPLNYSYAFYSRDEATALRWLFVGAWLIVPLGVAGLLVPSLRVRRDGFWVWASFVPVYAASVAAFFVSSRYRMPLLVPLCAAAGATLVRVFDDVRTRDFRGLAPLATCVLLAGAVTFWPLRVDEGLGGERTRKAVWLIEQGRVDEAQRYIDSIQATHSHPGVLHFRAGEALATASRFDAAIAHYLRALAIDGPRPAIELPLGQALVMAGRFGEAIPHLAAAFDGRYRQDVAATWLVRAMTSDGQRDKAIAFLDALPEQVAASGQDTAADLGTLALQLEAPDRAVRWWRLATALTPDRAEAHETLGATLLLLNRDDEALAPLETANRLDPASASIRLNLALALARLGRVDEALVHAREAERLAPGEPRVADLLQTLDRGARR